ncbi:MAG: MFS transporter [Rhodospirillales bacterium]|nr:MFS transporter [Rhodospirillales bacterium]
MSAALADSAPALTRRWWVLGVMVAAQFMFVVDAFIVNVAIPSIRSDLHAGSGAVQAVISLYQIAYAALVITGGRLGDIHGRKRVFLAGLVGFTTASLACGAAATPEALVLARIAQGASAALMSPQVLATIHTLFTGTDRAKAFGLFGVALGLGGGAGFVLGGWLITLDLAGTGWRMIFFVNGPVGLAIAAAAWRLMPDTRPQPGLRLDVAGAVLLFLALALLIGPVLVGQDTGWPWPLLLVAALGLALLAAFIRHEARVAQRGGLPLIDLDLLRDAVFRRGLIAAAFLFGGNISFYLLVTLYLQGGLGASPLQSGLCMLPLALAFVVASRRGAAQVARHGPSALIRGCGVQLAGLAVVALVVIATPAPPLPALALALAVFGAGQGLVMAPLFGTILGGVRHAHAGAGAGILTTAQQVANGAGVAVLGAVYGLVQAAGGDRIALLAGLALLADAVLATAAALWVMRRAGTSG